MPLRLRSRRWLALVLLVPVVPVTGARPTRWPGVQRTQSAATLAPAERRDAGGVVGGRLAETRRPAGNTPVRNRRAGPTSVRARIAAASRGTYIHDLLVGHDSSLARWPNRVAKPLRVWVQPSPALPGWQPVFAKRVRDAFEDWQGVGIPMRFAFTPDSAAADVHVTWVDRFDEPISGKTVWARNDGWWIVGGDIILALRHRQGPALDSPAIKAIALHEIGHLLGLDHTPDSTNIMAPRVRVRELSTADRATLRLLYEVPAGRVR